MHLLKNRKGFPNPHEHTRKLNDNTLQSWWLTCKLAYPMGFIIQPKNKKTQKNKKFTRSDGGDSKIHYHRLYLGSLQDTMNLPPGKSARKSSLHYTNSDNLCKCEVWNSKELGPSRVLGAWYPQMMCDCRNPEFIALKVTHVLSWVCSLRSKFTNKTSDLINNKIKELEDNH